MKRMNGMIIGTALAVAALLSACAGGPETKELHATLTRIVGNRLQGFHRKTPLFSPLIGR